MIIRKISTRAFAKHKAVDLELPPTGIVTVTGKNGHGKSSIVEAVSQGGWNETLRGAPGWHIDGKSGVEIEFDGGSVMRSVSTKHVLKWRTGEEDGAAEYATRTKSQTALESHIGTFHVWSHACTFHTDDVGRFAAATDANRKRLLEEVLELDRVETGYRKASEETNVERRKLTNLGHAYELSVEKSRGLKSRLDLLDDQLEDVPDLAALRVEERRLRAEMEEASTREDAARTAETEALNALRDKQREITIEEQRIQRFTSMAAECPTCEQMVGQEHVGTLVAFAESGLVTEKADVVALQAAATESVANARVEGAAHMEARIARQDAVAQGRAAIATQKRNDDRQGKRGELAAAHQDALDAEAALAMEQAEQVIHVGEMEACVSVLSFTGVRAALLDGAVKALQDLARDWLARLGLQNLTVNISSQTKSKKGSVSDKISFEVIGAGGGYGYRGCSTGERRRIDIAMMFALGELAADSRGVSKNSTLFVDEVFDGLDEDGRDAVIVMLDDISRERCVVVITHSKPLTSRLNASLKIVAVDGNLSVVG